MSKIYFVRDLLLAVIDGQMTSGGLFPEMVAYYARRSKAFQNAFGIHFSAEEARVREETAYWDALFQAAIASYQTVRTPFSDSLEMPRSYLPLLEAFQLPFEQRQQALLELHLKFLVALCERWYGEQARQTITSSDLLRHGFDDREPAPEPFP
jgi:hypothetical protein